MSNLVMIVLLLPLGVWLLRLGRWPRRVGETPHCPWCGYIVTGVSGDKCPECGGRIWAGNLVIGERHRRHGLALLGLLLILCPIAFWAMDLGTALRNVQWYHFRPTGWVIGDLDLPTAAGRD